MLRKEGCFGTGTGEGGGAIHFSRNLVLKTVSSSAVVYRSVLVTGEVLGGQHSREQGHFHTARVQAGPSDACLCSSTGSPSSLEPSERRVKATSCSVHEAFPCWVFIYFLPCEEHFSALSEM